jgi:hypothetical protein
MWIMRFRIFLVIYFSLAFHLLSRAEDIPPDLLAGDAAPIFITADECRELRDYASKPTVEQSARILDLIIEKYKEHNLNFIRSKHVIVFLSIDGINQVIHIGKRSSISFTKVIRKRMVDPNEIKIHARDLVAVWIADDADIYVTSVKVDITKSTRSLHLFSFESPPMDDDDGGGESKLMELGIRHFKIPIDYGNLDITFVRRDVDTYERRTWSRSFQILNLPSVLNVGLEMGIFAPLSDAETVRYEIASNVIRESKIEPIAFFTFTFFTPAERRFSRGIFENIIPDPLIGVSLPIDLDDAKNNSYMLGCSWRFKSDLFRLSLGLQFGEKLLGGYQVGDTATEGDRIAEQFTIEPMIGFSLSITYISELLTGI